MPVDQGKNGLVLYVENGEIIEKNKVNQVELAKNVIVEANDLNVIENKEIIEVGR